MNWNIGDKWNLFLRLKSELGPFHVVLTTPKFSHENRTVTEIGKQQLPVLEKSDSKQDNFCLKWTI